MMQFIVLGVIPGTHFQVTFAWIAGAFLLAGAAVAGYHLYRNRNLESQPQQTLSTAS